MLTLTQYPVLQKLIRFLSGGGLIWLFRVAFTTLLAEWMGVDPVIAYRFGLVISFFLYFFMNLHFIFLVKDRLIWRMFKYSCVSIAFLSTDGVLMQLLYEQFHWHYLAALLTSTAVLLGLKFVIYDRLVFQESKP